MKDKRKELLLLILSLLVITIGITYAYYSAVVQGTGNTNATTSANTATLGEVEFNGTSTFDSSTLDDIYPGYIGIQTFTIGPYKNGTGIYEVDLEAIVPEAFGNDIKLTIYKTDNHTSNYLTRTEGTLTVNNNRYVKQDTVTTTGTLTKVYESSLTTTTETMIEQVEFVIANNAFTTPTVTPDGYYTYYAVYEYLDNEKQNNQQGLNFSSKITVKYIEKIYNPARDTLEELQALNPNLVVTPSTASNPDFSAVSPPFVATTLNANFEVNAEDYVTYGDDFTYDIDTGIYTLVNPVTCQWEDCYSLTNSKYVISNDPDLLTFGSSDSTPLVDSDPYTEYGILYISGAGATSVSCYAYSYDELYKKVKSENQLSGLYELEDDYGTSYYFRGDITNNYVKFGIWQTDYYNGYVSANHNNEGFTSLSACQSSATNCTKYASAGDDMYWRIIRINGDGSIRMIYDGVSTYGTSDKENGSTIIRSIGNGAYYTSVNDNAYVGYMYGTVGSNNYNDTHANTFDSPIKTRLDSWYQTELTSYASYISDTLFCNDRSIASNNTINYANNNLGTSHTSNGYGNSSTLYAPYGRLIEEFYMSQGNKAILTCPNKNDRFTVADTSIGNGALTYPVGLITSDELNIAGGVIGENYDYYLISGRWYVGTSPYEFESMPAISSVDSGGDINIMRYVGNMYDASIRPVINLKHGVINAGDGTANNPFRIQ